MALKLKNTGEASHLQDHNLLKNLSMENQHPITSITDLDVELGKRVSNTVFKAISDKVEEIDRKIQNGEIGGGGEGGVDKDEVEKIVDEVLNEKLETIYNVIKDLQIQNINAYVKYDKKLNLASNTCGDYFVDSGLYSISTEKEDV